MLNTFLRIGDRLQPLEAPAGRDYWIAESKVPSTDSNWYQSHKLCVDAQLNTYTIGFGSGYGSGNYSAVVTKYDPLGNVVWNVASGAHDSDDPKMIELYTVNNDVIALYTGRSLTAGYSTTVMRLTTTGAVVWKKEITTGTGINTTTIGYDISVTPQGDIYVILMRSATQYDPISGVITIVMKLNSTGALIWQKVLDTPTATEASKIKATSSGGAFTTIFTAEGMVVSYINSSGTMQWSKRFSGLTQGRSYCPSRMTVDSSNNLYVAYAESNSIGLLKISQAGTTLAQKAISRTDQNDAIFEVTFDPTSQNIYVLSWTYAGVGILRYNLDLNYVWQRVSSGIPGYYGSTLVTDVNGDLYFQGWLNANAIIKVASNGALVGTHAGPSGSFTYTPMILPTNDITFAESSVTLAELTGLAVNILTSPNPVDVGPINSTTILGKVYKYYEPSGVIRSMTATPANTVFTVTEMDQYNVGVIRLSSSRTADLKKKYVKTGFRLKVVGSTADASSNLVVVGNHTTATTGTTSSNPWIMKLASDGSVAWSQGINAVLPVYQNITPGCGTFTAVASSPDGSTIAVGTAAYLTTSTSHNMLVVKFSSTGTVVWQKYITRMSNAIDVICNSNNDIYVVGTSKTTSAFDPSNCFIAKISSAGALLWTKLMSVPDYSFYGNINYAISSLALDSAGNVYMANGGSTMYYVFFPASNVTLTKLNSSGTIQWTKGITTPGTLPTRSEVVIDSADNVIYHIGNSLIYFNTSGVVTQQKGSLVWGTSVLVQTTPSSVMLAGTYTNEYYNSTMSTLNNSNFPFTNHTWTLDTTTVFTLADFTTDFSATVGAVPLVVTTPTFTLNATNIAYGYQYAKSTMT